VLDFTRKIVRRTNTLFYAQSRCFALERRASWQNPENTALSFAHSEVTRRQCDYLSKENREWDNETSENIFFYATRAVQRFYTIITQYSLILEWSRSGFHVFYLSQRISHPMIEDARGQKARLANGKIRKQTPTARINRDDKKLRCD